MATASYNVQKDSLRQQIGIVLQEPFLFSDTVMNNLRLRPPGCHRKRLHRSGQNRPTPTSSLSACPTATTPYWRKRGRNLSQGQRQLLTIARMMVQNPRLVILDEATATSIPAPSSTFRKPSTRLMAGPHQLLSSPTRLRGTIRDSDQILGAKIRRNRRARHPRCLMQQQGLYHELYMSQFKGKLAGVGVGG